MKKATATLALAALLALTVSAHGAGPEDPPTTMSGTARALTTTHSYAGTSETTIAGMVYDNDVNPLGDVAVKLYVGGMLTEETRTSLDGRFEMMQLVDLGRDVSIDLWFVPTDDTLLMENVVLKESSSALQNSLYSKCLKRVEIAPITDVVVKLLDVTTKSEKLKRSDCL